jgi:hypothetical protein
MILEASRAGVDCVKFQKSYLSEKFTKDALLRSYESRNSFGKSYGEHKQFLEFSIEQFRELKEYAENLNLIFSASAMDRVRYFQNFYFFKFLYFFFSILKDFIRSTYGTEFKIYKNWFWRLQ